MQKRDLTTGLLRRPSPQPSCCEDTRKESKPHITFCPRLRTWWPAMLKKCRCRAPRSGDLSRQALCEESWLQRVLLRLQRVSRRHGRYGK